MRLAACAADCIDDEGGQNRGPRVTSPTCGCAMTPRSFLEAFQTGSFYGPLSWNKLFDARLFPGKGIHYDETMLLAMMPACCTACLRVRNATAWVICSTITAPARADHHGRFPAAQDWMTCGCTGIGCNTFRQPGRTEYRNGPWPAYWRIFTSSGAKPVRPATCTI